MYPTATGRKTHRSPGDEFRGSERSLHAKGGPFVGPSTKVIVCDVQSLNGPDVGTVDSLARLALTARRLGCRVRLAHASPELRELLAFAGLAEVMPCASGSRIEPGRQAEEREELLRVKEEGDPTDLPGPRLDHLE